jgi:hypothetical protein
VRMRALIVSRAKSPSACTLCARCPTSSCGTSAA